MDFTLSIWPAIKVGVFYSLWFFGFFWILTPKTAPRADLRLVESLVEGSLFTVVSGYALAGLGLFQLVPILALYLGLVDLVLRRRGEGGLSGLVAARIGSVGATIFDWLEGYSSPRQAMIRVSARVKAWFRGSQPRFSVFNVFALSLFIVMGGLRFYPRLSNYVLGEPDPYVHLVWTKLMRSGILFPDGVYPMGYHALAGTLQSLTNVDYYHVLRFLGPLGSTVLILTIYLFLRGILNNRYLALLGTAIFGLSTENGLPAGFARQVVSLPMEYSLVFCLPGLYFLSRYLEDGDRRSLWLAGATWTSVLLIHYYGALFLALGSVFLIIAEGICLGGRLFSRLPRLLIAVLASGAAGSLPVLLALGSGLPWMSAGPQWVKGNMYWTSWPSVWDAACRLCMGRPFAASAILGIGTLLLALGFIEARRHGNPWLLTLTLFTGALALLYTGPVYFGFSLVEKGRVEMVLAIMVSCTAVCALALLIRPWTRLHERVPEGMTSLMAYGAGLAFLGLWLSFTPPLYSQPKLLEYNAAARAYLTIKRDYPPLDWTIIGPVEQYEEALEYGYHYELWKFVARYPVSKAAATAFDVDIPTRYIFIYVEKEPLVIWNAAEMSSLDPDMLGPTEKYYRNWLGRRKLEQEAQNWCDVYQRHHDNMRVYYEDQTLRIYVIEHDPSPYLKSKEQRRASRQEMLGGRKLVDSSGQGMKEV